ncbi:hypothetical protein D3C78_1131860 [compost metagenome]
MKTVAEEELFNYSDIILRFPRDSVNRAYVEKMRFDSEAVGMANYVAQKYDLSIQDLCRLLDEDGVFDPGGGLLLDELQHKANLHFRQGKRRKEEREVAYAKVVSMRAEQKTIADHSHQEEFAVQMEYYVEVPPQFRNKCDIHQYNMMLRNEPYTRLLKTFFPGAIPDNLLDMFEKIDLNYKLPGEVINVLIHYLMSLMHANGEQRINRNFVDAIASNMLLKQVNTYEKAVHYIREQGKVKDKVAAKNTTSTASRGRSYAGRSGNVKPDIPIVGNQNTEQAVSEEEFAELIKMAEQMQASKNKGL